MFYAGSTGGFYVREIHGENIPADAVEITKEEHAALLAGQSKGRRIEADANGRPTLIDPPKDHRAAVAAERYRRETAGVVVGGVPIDTSRDSRALITGAALAATLDSAYICRWKTGGSFVELNAQQIIEMATAVRAHVQACFDREAELLAEIDAGTYTEAMLDLGWPA